MKRAICFLTLALMFLVGLSCEGFKADEREVKLIPVLNGEEYQYIDRDGKIVINPQFSVATVFRNGLALVRSTGDEPKWGFIDESGKYIKGAIYKRATVFNEGIAWVVNENEPPTAINQKGEDLFKLKQAEKVTIFSEGLAAFLEVNKNGEELWGFVDKNGNIKIQPQFFDLGHEGFKEGKCVVKNKDDKAGYIDQEGKIVINYQFDEASAFINGKSIVYLGEKAGLIDKSGTYLINPQFTEMMIDGDIVVIQQNDKYGWADKNGKILINPQFEQVRLFNNNKLAPVEIGDKWGYIDKSGKIIINPQFDIATCFNGGLAAVTSDDKTGFIDREGKYVINPQFDDVSIDYLIFNTFGSALSDEVQTDFFDVDAIVSRLQFEKPEGFDFNSKVSEMAKKYGLSNSDFGMFDDFHYLFINNEINKNADLALGIKADVYDFISWEYDLNTSPTVFGYIVNLKNKGEGKAGILIEAIKDKLKLYTDITEEKRANSEFKGFAYKTEKSKIFFVQTANDPENEVAVFISKI